MRSMTGYGCGEAGSNEARVTVEISSVNRKHPDFRVNLPRELAVLEPDMRTSLQERIARGCVNVAVSYELGGHTRSGATRIDERLARQLGARLHTLAKEIQVAPPTLGDVLAIPGVLLEDQCPLPLEQVREQAFTALERALDALNRMRDQEGQALAEALLQHLRTMRALAPRIRDAAEQAVEEYRDRLIERIRKLRVDVDPDDDRVIKETTFFADRSDVTEEIVRLESHIEQMKQLISGSVPCGRDLEFLCQEMNREINTLSAKVSQTSLSELAFQLKSELGKLREQVMNVE